MLPSTVQDSRRTSLTKKRNKCSRRTHLLAADQSQSSVRMSRLSTVFYSLALLASRWQSVWFCWRRTQRRRSTRCCTVNSVCCRWSTVHGHSAHFLLAMAFTALASMSYFGVDKMSSEQLYRMCAGHAIWWVFTRLSHCSYQSLCAMCGSNLAELNPSVYSLVPPCVADVDCRLSVMSSIK